MPEKHPQFPAEGGPPPERNLYIRALRIWTRVALILLLASFAIYALGLMTPAVPMDELPRYWSLGADEFVQQTGLPTGWEWTSRLYQSDVLSIISAVFLAAVTGICLLSILPSFLKTRDWAYVAIVILQVILFIVAALPPRGGH
jgi:hypothetical protein